MNLLKKNLIKNFIKNSKKKFIQKRKGRVACHIFDSKKCAIYRPCLVYLSEKNSRPANSEEDIK